MLTKLSKKELAEKLDYGTDANGALLINGHPVRGSAGNTRQQVCAEIEGTVFELKFELSANGHWTPKCPERAKHLDNTNRNFADRMAI